MFPLHLRPILGFVSVRLLAFCFAVPSALAQDAARLSLVPRDGDELGCGDEYVVELRLDGAEEDVWGYQVYLRYPATGVRPLRYEPAALTETVWVSGPEGFASELSTVSCEGAVNDAWQDGLGVDVLAVGATAWSLPDLGGEPGAPAAPLSGDGIVLGRLVFEALSGPAAPPIAQLEFNRERCREFLDQEARLFDAEGRSLSLAAPDDLVVTLRTGNRVESITCGRATIDGTSQVSLSWVPAVDLDVTGYRIRRGERLVGEVDATVTTFTDTQPEAATATEYAVAPVEAGGRAGCLTTCEILESQAVFFRSDVNGDQRSTISDPVVLLPHLFSGGEIPCQDAADADDDGRVVLTDAIFILNFIFLEGPQPPPPGARVPGNDLPGIDPTPDDLGCAQGL